MQQSDVAALKMQPLKSTSWRIGVTGTAATTKHFIWYMKYFLLISDPFSPMHILRLQCLHLVEDKVYTDSSAIDTIRILCCIWNEFFLAFICDFAKMTFQFLESKLTQSCHTDRATITVKSHSHPIFCKLPQIQIILK